MSRAKGRQDSDRAGQAEAETSGPEKRDETETKKMKTVKRKIRTGRLIVTVALAALAAGAVFCYLGNRGAFLPRWIRWQERTVSDQTGTREIRLGEKKVEVISDGNVIWTSGEGILVQDGLCRDIDNDGEEELILLCWRKGKYGRARPFWVEKNDKSWSQHLYVYSFGGGEIREKWVSSHIGTEVAEIAFNGKGGPFTGLLFTDTEGKVSSWRWDSWGFTKEETEVSFIVFGDNLIHEPIYRYGLNQGGSFDFLFENVRDLIETGDVAVINQETPLTEDPAMYGDYPRFGTPAQAGEAIAEAGFDVVTCATNHMLDRGEKGLAFTKEFFTARNIRCLGIGTGVKEGEADRSCTDHASRVIIRKNNICFALLNYTYGTNGLRLPEGSSWEIPLLEEDRVRADIAAAETEADAVIVFVHWGTEDSGEIDELQRYWSRVFLESGADVTVGSHPHTLQPYGILKDDQGHEMLIYYSVGNFVSAQREKIRIRGGAARFTIALTPEGYKVTEYGLEPLAIIRDSDGKYMVGELKDIFQDGN